MSASTGQDSPSGGGAGRLRALAERAASSLGMELVHLTYRKEGRRWILRIFVDREGGVTLDDCARASDQLGTLIEVEEAIPHTYTLEVSSPGLDRPLFTEQDYRRFTGRRARLKTHRPVDGRRHFVGTLEGVAEGRVMLSASGEETVAIPLEILASGRLEPDLDGFQEPSQSRPGGQDGVPGKEKVQE